LKVITDATQSELANVESASEKLMAGATERDIVYSGLEEVMSTATSEVIEIAEKQNLDLRTAAYVLAITRLNDYYTTRGLEV
jgi:glutamate dehydrogenase (NAD(P)+)